MLTGLPDDAHKILKPGHPIFGLAAHAFRYQDSWPDDEHISYWVEVLPLWPRKTGQRSDRVQIGEVMDHLELVGGIVDRAEQAVIIGGAIEATVELIRKQDYAGAGFDARLRSAENRSPDCPETITRAPLVVPQGSMPLVLDPRLTEYAGRIDEGIQRKLDNMWQKATAKITEMEHSGELERLGCLHVRGGDLNDAEARWRRQQEQGGLTAKEIDAMVAYERQRDNWPKPGENYADFKLRREGTWALRS